MFRRLFWGNLVLALPVLVFSEQIQDWLGYSLDVPGQALVPPVLGTAIYLWGGRPFLVGGWHEARARTPGMMLLIAMAITVAFGASLATELGLAELDFWWELAALVVVMLFGHWQEMRAVGQAGGALDALSALLPDIAQRVADDRVDEVPVDELQVGDLVLVSPGGRVPGDGEIVSGTAEMDESMITGESRPVTRGVGDRVVAGTVATDSSLRVRISAVGDDTSLAGIRRLVGEAQRSRSATQALADRAAGWLFYIATGAALVTLVAWTVVGNPAEGVIRTVTVLVIACPHALGLAIPLVVSISTTLSARAGILVKDRRALELMREIDVVMFDKTGTLTLGAHRVVDSLGVDGVEADQVLALAAAVESESEHPVGRAIMDAAPTPVRPATAIRAIPGHGVRGQVDGAEVAVGGGALLRNRELAVDELLAQAARRWADAGRSVVYVVGDDAVVGAIALADPARPESADAVADLRSRDIGVALITGDAEPVAREIGRQLGIDRIFAEVLPAEKDTAVVAVQDEGRRVAMVGDGINDAPALARADVGIAIGAGTDVAAESAGVVLARDDPRAVGSLIDLSAASYRKMVENLLWATGYNLVAIPVAAGVFGFSGVALPPAVAALMMSLSTIVVAVNAQSLRRLELAPPEAEGHRT
jgi:Cu2+-exporting ATPase